MRLVLVNHEYPPCAGGAATASAQIAAELSHLGHEVLVVTSAVPDCPECETHGSLTVVRVPSRRRSCWTPTTAELLSCSAGLAWRLPGLTREFRADAVLAFFAVPAGILAVRTARQLAIPALVSLRGSDVPGFPAGRLGTWSGLGSRPLVRATLRRADLVVPNCEYLHDLATSFLPEIQDKTVTIANGVDPQTVAARPAGSGSGELHLVTVGQLIARKRIHLAVQAVRELRQLGIPVRLTVIGDGPLRNHLERFAQRLGLADRVAFLGYQPRPAVLAALRCHDVFVMSSAAEGMSNALLEAMACGLPIVTTRNASREVVLAAECGAVVAAPVVPGLVRALRELHRDEPRRQTLAAAALDYAQTHTWGQCARRFEAAFLKVLGQTPQPVQPLIRPVAWASLRLNAEPVPQPLLSSPCLLPERDQH